jgi:hypothetical protein
MQIQSGDNIKIKPGCYMRTMDHVISADESEMIEIAIKTMDWAGKITDLFHYENKDAIHQAVQGLRNRYNGEFDATILLEQLDQLDQHGQAKNPDSHWLDLHFPGSNDRSCHLPAWAGLLLLEMLLPNFDHDNHDPAYPLCSSDASTHSPGPTSGTHSKDTKPQT